MKQESQIAPGSVTQCLSQIRKGDDEAVTDLWARFEALVRQVARKRLGKTTQAVADEEDVVVTVFATFVRRIKGGELSSIVRRNEIWRMLITIANRKASNQIRDLNRQKRRGPANHDPADMVALDQVADNYAQPDWFTSAADALEHFLDHLDEEQQQIVVARLEGRDASEIAAMVNRSVPTVFRRLRLIQTIWREVEFE